jgi:hypothetical protein
LTTSDSASCDTPLQLVREPAAVFRRLKRCIAEDAGQVILDRMPIAFARAGIFVLEGALLRLNCDSVQDDA